MPKCVLLAGLYHETHSFLPNKTGRDKFELNGVLLGDAIIKKHANDKSTTDAFLRYANEAGWDVIPTVSMSAGPAGMVEQPVVDEFWQHLETGLRSHAQSIDAIFLVLHGAMVSESLCDVEGTILERIHHLLPANKHIPVVGVLDLHCNFTQKMAEFSTCLRCYRENPHGDAYQAAYLSAKHLDDILSLGLQPHTHLIQPPLLFSPPGTGTHAAPMRAVLDRAIELEQQDANIMCFNIFGGYSFADIEEAGFSISCVVRDDSPKVEDYLRELAHIAIDNRDLGHPQDNPIDHVISEVKTLDEGPILIIEPSDNIGGGAPGDATGGLKALLDSGLSGIVAVIADKEAVEQCQQAGLGNSVSLAIGGKTDSHHGDPITLEGTVINLTDGKYELEDKQSHMAAMGGIYIDMLGAAVIETPQARILLTKKKNAPMDLGQLRSQGIIPEAAHIILVKSTVSHKKVYDPIAKHSFYVDTPGLCTSNLTRLPYKHIRRPIFPLDSSVDFTDLRYFASSPCHSL